MEQLLILKKWGDCVLPQPPFIIKTKLAAGADFAKLATEFSTDEGSKSKHVNMLITKVGLVEKAELNKEMFDKIYPGRNIENSH